MRKILQDSCWSFNTNELMYGSLLPNSIFLPDGNISGSTLTLSNIPRIIIRVENVKLAIETDE